MATLGIDPGLREVGVAIWCDRKGLLFAKLIRELKTESRMFGIVEAVKKDSRRWRAYSQSVIEYPEIYPQRFWRGPPNTIRDLAAVAFGIAVAIDATPRPQLILPKTWKGQVPKEIHNARTLERAGIAEKDLIKMAGAPKTKIHNVLDAIGLAIWGEETLA